VDKQRILIVDDSDLVLAMIFDALTESGYDVVTASNCIEANQYLFAKEKPKLILMDVMMPILQGDKTVQIMKQTAEFTTNIPIVYISSKPAAELEQLVADTGVAGYLCKPFTDDVLLTKVRSLIK
jgi:DNA-binding response OmpR family regulator